MKHTLRITALLAAVLMFAACEKDKENVRHERDIVYTVDADQHNAHLETDTEFDALLDDFCDFAKSGSTVTFYNALNVDSPSKGAGTKEVTYRTTSREDIKRWMRQMENEGRTVTITYDSHTGTYNGLAYKNGAKLDIDSQCDSVQCFVFRYQDNTEDNFSTIHSNDLYSYR